MAWQMHRGKGYYIAAIILLLAGTTVYILFRDGVAIVEWARQWLGIGTTLRIEQRTLHYFVAYCLSDALWYAALLLTQRALLDTSRQSLLLFYLSVALPYLLETAQWMNIMPGTFDWLDIATYTIIAIPFIVTTHSNERHSISRR